MIWRDRAEADLDEIWQFTKQRWGVDQADRYLAGLNAAVADDRTRSLRARRLDFVDRGWFRMRYIRHFIYFREDGEALLVIRVLHDSMDETLHLP